MFKFESGSFIVAEGKKFKPGINPFLQDSFSMGQNLGDNIVLFYKEHDNITSFEIVNMKTGDSLDVKILDYDKSFKDYFQMLTDDEKAEIAAALALGQKIEAIKAVRRILNMGLKDGKAFIESQYLWDALKGSI
jgi:hypothetical protein